MPNAAMAAAIGMALVVPPRPTSGAAMAPIENCNMPSTQRLVTWIVPLPPLHARLPRYIPAPLSGSAAGTTITNAP